jgi:LCP family protein required for cell wall assembly
LSDEERRDLPPSPQEGEPPAPATWAGRQWRPQGADTDEWVVETREAEDAEAEAEEPEESEEPEEAPGRGLWARFLAGSLLIVVSMATATAVSLLVFVTDLAKGLGGLAAVRNQLQVVDPGNPQTILILGSDKRPGETGKGRSDTTILLRVSADEINLMSIPRDLRVNIPGLGIDRFNAAYSYGGPKLTVKVAKQLTGLEINHVINVDFNGFADAVNAIDCAYVDVDRHYFHSNVGLAASEQYAEINVPAGYQRMCGFKALQYVRYRHDDNDLVRSARQQAFLREARQQVPPSKLITDRNQLLDIMKAHVTSDIDEVGTVISLGKLFFAARNAPVRQIHFPAQLGGASAIYVTASESAIRDAVERFLGEGPTVPAQEPSSGKQGETEGSKPSGGDGKEPAPAPPPLIDATTFGQQYAAKVAGVKTKAGKPMLDFPVFYPTRLAPNSTFSDDSRAFPIDGPEDKVYRGYKIVASQTGAFTAYYGVSGTDWKDPPILDSPSETKTIGGRDYLLFWDGDRLRLVGWKTDRASYWVDNTLLNTLTPGQMLGIAQTMRELGR